MVLPDTGAGRRAWAAIVRQPSRTLLCTDFDGVLSPIVDEPGQAWASAPVVDALARLGGLLGQVAVVTGRPARQAVRLGRLRGRPGLESLQVRGLYGHDRWDADTDAYVEPEPPARLAAAASELGEVLAGHGLAGARVEEKPLGFAVHTREASDPDAALDALDGPLRELASRHGLRLEPGRNVVELRLPGSDKGDAVRALVEEHRPAVVVFVGDDLGDVPAFRAVADLREEGRIEGLLVCSASAEEDALEGLSDVVVHGPAGVADLFGALADDVGRAPAPHRHPLRGVSGSV